MLLSVCTLKHLIRIPPGRLSPLRKVSKTAMMNILCHDRFIWNLALSMAIIQFSNSCLLGTKGNSLLNTLSIRQIRERNSFYLKVYLLLNRYGQIHTDLSHFWFNDISLMNCQVSNTPHFYRQGYPHGSANNLCIFLSIEQNCLTNII